MTCTFFVTFWCLSYYTLFVWEGYFLASNDLVGDGAMGDGDAWLFIFASNVLLVLLLPVRECLSVYLYV